MEYSYRYDAATSSLMRYFDPVVDYDDNTYQKVDLGLEKLGDCRFYYYDGSAWQETWSKDKGSHPVMVKLAFRFNDETKDRDFIVNIPVSL